MLQCAAPGLDLAVEYLRIRLALHLQDADQPAFGARERMIDEDVIAGHIELELDDGGAARPER